MIYAFTKFTLEICLDGNYIYILCSGAILYFKSYNSLNLENTIVK